MSRSPSGLWISLILVALCVVLFFFNRRSRFLVPFSYLRRSHIFFYRIIVGLIISLLLLLPLRISLITDRQAVAEKNLPIQIIFDVSLSMAANDISPSRFSAAKSSLISLVQRLDGYAVSLIVFSGKPIIYIPFSSSSSAITTKLSAMNLSDFPPVQEFLGTAIGDALLLGIANFQQFVHQDLYKPGIVILITDGDSNIGFDPEQVIAYYQKIQVPVYVLGVGQSDYLIGRDTWGSDVTTNINPVLLQSLARDTGGEYYRVLGSSSFDDFFTQLSESITHQQHQYIQNTFLELNDYLVRLLFAMLLVLFAYRRRIYRSL